MPFCSMSSTAGRIALRLFVVILIGQAKSARSAEPKKKPELRHSRMTVDRSFAQVSIVAAIPLRQTVCVGCAPYSLRSKYGVFTEY